MPGPSISTILPSAIYDELRASILSQVAAPGTTFTESAVALQFGVSRPTAKMAIERLVSEGLLHREVHQAARVPELSRADIVDLFDTRAVVESAAAAKLASEGTVPREALDAHRRIQAGADGDLAYAPLDIAFHRALVTGQPSTRLVRMHSLIMGEIELCIGQVQANHLRTAAEVSAEHQAILDAVGAADPELAARLTRSHVEASRERLLAHVDASGTADSPSRENHR
ncbi:GntR family transcriptional regulator [Galbitalea soli]|nr:GntR family transcriptional regulator [Galbitalea soli]NYJ29538.1 DNA-binding GntR family transcriptional regulator [Galbitalea soli]